MVLKPAVLNPILNWDFELGPVNWQESSTHEWELIVQYPQVLPIAPYDGSWGVWLGGDYDDISYIQQQVIVPASGPYLSYMHLIGSTETRCGNDVAKVMVNGATVDKYNLCTATGTSGWVQYMINLSAYAGMPVMIQIRTETDSTMNSNLFIDSVKFQSNPISLLPPTSPDSIIDASLARQEAATR